MPTPEEIARNRKAQEFVDHAENEARLAAYLRDRRRIAIELLLLKLAETVKVLEACEWPTGEYESDAWRNRERTYEKWADIGDVLVIVNGEHRLGWKIGVVWPTNVTMETSRNLGHRLIFASGEIGRVGPNDHRDTSVYMVDEISVRFDFYDRMYTNPLLIFPSPFNDVEDVCSLNGVIGSLDELQMHAYAWKETRRYRQ